MIKETVQLLALFLTLEAAYFISKSNLGLTAPVIAELSRTKYGANLSVLKNLAAQNAENRIGMVLLLLSVILQTLSTFILFPCDPNSGFTYPRVLCSLLISIVISVVVFICCLKASNYIFNKLQEEANLIILNSRQKS